jgi:dGTPase
MSSPREERQELECHILSPLAALAEQSKGRERLETECNIRTCFQRDIDRITHSKAFRRLKHKTQVFLQPEGDHYRTRLTHTLEVSRIGRTIARALRLNEDLTEAIALGHDLGHTPFGHAGERALNEILVGDGGYKHNHQSLRIVERIERDGQGLNLTHEVRDGILCHTGDKYSETAEGDIIRIADRIAYINHDVDDAIRAGILNSTDIPGEITRAFGTHYGGLIDTLILDMIDESNKQGKITFSPQTSILFNTFYDFMFNRVYINMKAKSEESKVHGIIHALFEHYAANPDKLPKDFKIIAKEESLQRAVSDYVSGMTDKYAMYLYGELFIPEAWQVR